MTQAPASFPSTMWTEVLALKGDETERRRERLAGLIERYWRPVYWAVRSYRNFTDDEARDLTQEFFVGILEGHVISTVDRERGSFRHYLRGALRRFLLDEYRKEHAEKRGGGKVLSLDLSQPGPQPPALGTDPAAALDRAWAIQILDDAMKELESSVAAADVELFRAHELNGAKYSELSARFNLATLDVQNRLRFCRRKLRAILMRKVGAYVRDEAGLFDELRELFGI